MYAMLYEPWVNPGMVLTHDQLLNGVWDVRPSVESVQVRTMVKRLRRDPGDDEERPG